MKSICFLCIRPASSGFVLDLLSPPSVTRGLLVHQAPDTRTRGSCPTPVTPLRRPVLRYAVARIHVSGADTLGQHPQATSPHPRGPRPAHYLICAPSPTTPPLTAGRAERVCLRDARCVPHWLGPLPPRQVWSVPFPSALLPCSSHRRSATHTQHSLIFGLTRLQAGATG